MPAETAFFFPLRTNVEFFRSSETYLDLTSRVKQALILYDHVAFQQGVYERWVGPKGSMETMLPFSSGRQKHVPEFSDDNKSEYFTVRVKPSDAGPEVPLATIMHSPLQHFYSAEFHSLTREISASGISDIEMCPIEMTSEAKGWATKAVEADSERTNFAKDEPLLRKGILTNLYLDLLLIADLGWPASFDPLHAPLISEAVQGKLSVGEAPGFLSLDMQFPYVGDLSWEQIAEFREDPAVMEFRKKLSDIEQAARTMLPDASQMEIRDRISQIIVSDLIDYIRNKKSTYTGIARDLGQDILLEVFGAFFPPAALLEIGLATADSAKQAVELHRERLSWIAAFMKLQQLSNK